MTASPTTRATRPILALALVAVVTVIAASTWARVFTFTSLLLPLLGAAILPVAIAALFSRQRRGLPGVATSLIAFVPFTLLVTAVGPGGRASSAVSSFTTGVVHGWDYLLSSSVPATGDPALLVVPVALTWLAALVASELVIRTRTVIAPAIPSILLLIAARLFTPTGTDPSTLAAVLLAVGLVALVAARAGTIDTARAAARAADDRRANDITAEHQPAARRAVLLALPIAAVATLVAVLVGPWAARTATRPAFSLRELREQHLAAAEVHNPLDDLAGTLTTDPGTRLFTVETADARPDDARWLLVTLDAFDGQSWSSDAEFTRAGDTLPPDPVHLDVPAASLRQTIAIDHLQGVWLPAASRATAIHFDDPDQRAAVDPVSGTIVIAGGTSTGTTVPGLTYQVTSEVAAPPADALERAALPTSAAFAADIALPPGVPPVIATATTNALGRAASPFQQVAALEAYFHGNGFTYDPEAPTGHTYGDLARFLGDGKSAKHGTAEQFATAFTVMARTRGIPTRLAVGFRRGAADPGAAAGTNRYVVTRAETDVWPEVYFAGLGWVAFDPVPSAGNAPPKAQDLEAEEVAATKSRAAAAATTNDSAPAPANPLIEAQTADAATGRNWPAIVAAALAAIIVVLVLLALARRLAARFARGRRRQARRTDPDPGRRILGAWYEYVDLVERQGLGSGQALTVTDVGDAVAARWGEPAAAEGRALGRLVNDATFEPEPPILDTAAEAWRLEAAARAAVTAAKPLPPPTPEPTADPEHPTSVSHP